MNGAGTALADAATEFCADEFEMITQHPKQRGVGGHIHGTGLAVNLEDIFWHKKRERSSCELMCSKRKQSQLLPPTNLDERKREKGCMGEAQAAGGKEDCGGAANGLKGEGGMVGVRFGNYVR